MGEQAVVALDRKHRLMRPDSIALLEGLDLEPVPPRLPGAIGAVETGAEPQHGASLVDAAEDRIVALEHLHQHRGCRPSVSRASWRG